MGSDKNALSAHSRDNQSRRGYQRRGYSSAEMSAAAGVGKAAVFNEGGVIRVTRAHFIGDFGIIRRADVLIFYSDTDRRAGCKAVINAAVERKGVLLAARG